MFTMQLGWPDTLPLLVEFATADRHGRVELEKFLQSVEMKPKTKSASDVQHAQKDAKRWLTAIGRLADLSRELVDQEKWTPNLLAAKKLLSRSHQGA